jgi:hypothetical protein
MHGTLLSIATKRIQTPQLEYFPAVPNRAELLGFAFNKNPLM